MARPHSRLRVRQPTGRVPATKYYKGDIKPAPSPFKPKPKLKKKRPVLSRLLDLMLIGLVIYGLVYILSLKPRPHMQVSDLSYNSQATYQKAAEAYLKKLKNRNKVTLDEAKVADSLKKKFPEITTASLHLSPISQRPTVKLDIAAPTFFVTSNTSTYIVDAMGRTVALKQELPKISGLTVIDDQSGFELKKDQKAMSKSAVDFIKAVVNQSKKAGAPIKSLTLPPRPHELNLRTTDKPYFIKFNLAGDARSQIGQFLAAREHFTAANINPELYLDVRVSGKIFYR